MINTYDVYLRKSDRLIAKVYNVVKPLSSLSVALNFETGNNKTFCGYGAQSIELFDFLINNAKGEKNE